jgi:hypothetical protein
MPEHAPDGRHLTSLSRCQLATVLPIAPARRAPVLVSLVIAVLPLAGCAQLTAETRIQEVAFQAVHNVDAGQTLDIERHPGTVTYFDADGRRYKHTQAAMSEGTGMLDAASAIGSDTNDHEVWRYMAAEAGAHAAVTELLATWAPAWAVRVWEVVTIGADGAVVAYNATIGLRARF